MPAFETPEPIFATIDIHVGDVRINASDRTDTVVEVRPHKPSSASDVELAEETRVEYANGRLLVKAPKDSGIRSWFRWSGTIDVTVDLPSDSEVDAETSYGDLRCSGRLGRSQLHTSYGDVRIDETGELRLATDSGNITVARAGGRAEVTTSNGTIRITEIDGGAEVKSANGDITIGSVGGDLRANTASGSIAVDLAHGGVEAKTAFGNVHVREVVRGSIDLETAAGSLEIGIRAGTAAWLDVSSLYGTVHQSLDSTDDPGEAADTVEVYGRTSYGNITVRRT